MKKRSAWIKCVFLLVAVMGFTLSGFAGDEIAGTTEVTGYYQQYRNFSFKTGDEYMDFSPARIGGGGFSVAQNIADWFAIWSQLSIYGTKTQVFDVPIGWGTSFQYENKVRVINNLEGIRYQTKLHGPFRFYVKGGVGFTYYNFTFGRYGDVGASGTKFSAGYGGGTDIWFNRNIGIVFDVSHIVMGLPNLTDLPGRESFDSGLTYTTGLTIRF